jgi:uncharacterized membrane protein
VPISRSETGRVEAFSDGVFAIVITLLILGIQVPEARTSDAELWRALRALVPAIAAWVVSFAFVLVFWVAHHYLFAQLASVNRGLLWLNGLLLLCIAFTPFPTALQARYLGSPPATFLLSLAMFLSAASFSLLRWYSSFGPALMKPSVTMRERRSGMRRSLIGPALYGVATLTSFRFIWVSLAVQVIVPCVFVMPGRVDVVGETQ